MGTARDHAHESGGEVSLAQGGARFDRWAAWLSFACAVHCLLVPVAAAALPLAGASSALLEHPALELSLSGLVLLGAAFTAVIGFRRHRDARLVAIVAGAVAAYGLGHMLTGWPGSVLSVSGALVLAFSSLRSARLSHVHGEHCAH
jgi:hypothetical protein